MAVHHSINYFPEYSLSYWRFVSGAFPFLAGYLMTSVLVGRAHGGEDRSILGQRLIWRGFKLVALCVLLNIGLKLIWPSGSKGQLNSVLEFVGNVAVSGDYTTVSFSLLVPIGYTIALGGFLLLFDQLKTRVVLALALVFSSYCTVADAHLGGREYLFYFSIGILGMAAGFAADWIGRKISSVAWFAVVPWFVTQGLATALGTGERYPVYAANVGAALLLCQFIAQRSLTWDAGRNVLILWGRYSLLLYLAQIMTLVGLRVVVKKLDLAGGDALFWIAFLCVSVLQWLIAAGADKLRATHPWSDRAYRWVFG